MGETRTQPRPGRLAGALLRTQPEERLIAMARDGGAPAFGEIVRRHRASLLAFAATVAPPSRAEDVVQDSLLKAYAALAAGAEPDVLVAWLLRIVRNTAIDEQRGVRHHEQLDENYDGVEQPPQALARRESVAALVASLQDLPAAQREAIVQRELEGRGHAEIGRALEVSSGAVRQLIYRARHALRQAAGALIPAAVIRAAAIPGADQTAGGLGMAAAAKVGIAAVVATGTIVAGVSIDRHGDPATADALRLTTPGRAYDRSAPGPGGSIPGADRHGVRSGPSGSSRSGGGTSDGSGHSGPGPSGSSGSGGGSGSDGSGPGGSGSGGSGGSSDGGAGTSGSGDSISGSGSGSGDQLSSGGSSDGGGTSSTSGSGDVLEALDTTTTSGG